MTEDIEARLRRTLNARAGHVEFDAARWTATSFGAVIPTRTWLPLTPSTVTVTESPIIRVSPTRRVRISIVHSFAPRARMSPRQRPPA